ncbi:hypothetical protein GCM10010446_29270 [Streptomyces enissocaesilis]|uniref:Uncharacterized protein n=1 Tax=Streptomyces enissocaesilis TaxID=332589 RepID=A0ABN3X8Z3_9ACTN
MRARLPPPGRSGGSGGCVPGPTPVLPPSGLRSSPLSAGCRARGRSTFRLGGQAWGTQFRPEAMPRSVTGRARENAIPRKAGAGADEIVA